MIPLKPKGNSRRSKVRYEPNDREAVKNQYRTARAEIGFAESRVRELLKLGCRTQGIQDAVRQSRIAGTLEHNTKNLNARQLQSFASDLLDKLFNLEQEIVRNNERKTWDKDLRLIYVYEATALAKYAEQLDEAELTVHHDGLILSRKSATTRYNLDREGLNACLCDVLNYAREDELRHKRTEEIFDAGGFSSYITANTRARNLIAAERFASLIQSTPIYTAPKASPKSKRKKKKRKK